MTYKSASRATAYSTGEIVPTKQKEVAAQAVSDKWKLAAQRAQRTATWAKTMTKVLISQSSGTQPRWHVVNFLGPNKSESRGIVDLLAIRKSHLEAGQPLKRGDLFEIVLLQVKGGKAKWPSAEDRERLRAVKKIYNAKHVLLSEWKQGARARIFSLVEDDWKELLDPAEVFCPEAAPAARKKALQMTAGDGLAATAPKSSKAKNPAVTRAKDSAAKRAWATRRAVKKVE